MSPLDSFSLKLSFPVGLTPASDGGAFYYTLDFDQMLPGKHGTIVVIWAHRAFCDSNGLECI
jgi:hypothetical protein